MSVTATRILTIALLTTSWWQGGQRFHPTIAHSLFPVEQPHAIAQAATLDDRLALAESQYWQGDWLKALDTYATVLADVNVTEAQRAIALHHKGRLQMELRQFATALPNLTEALAHYQTHEDAWGEAAVLVDMANVYLQFTRETYALERLQQAEQLIATATAETATGQVDPRRLRAEIARHLTTVYFFQDNYDPIPELLTDAIAQYQDLVTNPAPNTPEAVVLQDQVKLTQLQRNVGLLAFVQNDFGTASAALSEVITTLESLEAGYRTLGHASEVGQVQHLLCETHTILGNSQQALATCGAALESFQSLGYDDWAGEVLVGISDIYDHVDPTDLGLTLAAEGKQQSMALLADAIDTFDTAANDWATAVNRLSLGEDAFFQGDYDTAQALYDQAIATYETLIETPEGASLGAPFRLGQVLLARGDIATQRGNYELALTDYQQAADIYEPLQAEPLVTLEEQRSLGYAYLDLGRTYSKLDRYSEAIPLLEQAIDIGRTFEEPFTVSIGLDALADISLELGEDEQRTALSSEANEVLANTLSYRIGLFEAPDDPLADAPAAVYLETAQAAGNRSLEAYAYDIVGIEHRQKGDYPAAFTAFQQALAIHQEVGNYSASGGTWSLIGRTHSDLGEWEAAIAAYQTAFGIQQQVGERFESRITLQSLAEIYQRLEQPETAIAFYKEAVNVSESLRDELTSLPLERQEAYLNSVAPTYRLLANLLLEQGRILEAQQVLELLKIQEIRDFIADQRAADTTTGVTLLPQEASLIASHGSLISFGQQVNECEQSRCAQLSELRDQRDALAREYQDTIDTLTGFVRQQLAADQALLDPEDLGGQARAILKQQPGTVVIYPLVLEDKLWLLWATEGRVVSRREVPVSRFELANTVVQFRELLQNPNSDLTELQATSQQLYTWLIAPLEDELQTGAVENLVFSLDRNTRYIPLAALHDGEQYLAERYTISHILSEELTDWRDRLPANSSDTRILAAGVSQGSANFQPLPYVPQEIDAIVQHPDPADQTGIYSGDSLLNNNFTFESLRDSLQEQHILHLATHGQFVPGQPEDSFLLLGNGDRLPIPDIRILGDYLEDVHLVVLSACETGLGGAQADGLEIAGMSYYFLDHGVAAIMASLWAVSDSSTSLLMQRFYANLASGQYSKAEALRQAQLSFVTSTETTSATDPRIIGQRQTEATASPLSHPYYWAPFILIGNGL
ncbi:MAG: CHAT domain-containing protein [Leptolyngbyaceae cyanobacterium]